MAVFCATLGAWKVTVRKYCEPGPSSWWCSHSSVVWCSSFLTEYLEMYASFSLKRSVFYWFFSFKKSTKLKICVYMRYSCVMRTRFFLLSSMWPLESMVGRTA